MNVVKGREPIKEAYRDQDRASAYIEDRFKDPFGAEQHRRQVTVINREIAKIRPARLLEVACGPARLTTDLARVAESVAVEQSPAMLEQARQRLKEAGLTQWTLQQGDAFDLQLPPASFDMAVTFRFIRHFDRNDRRRLLGQFRKVLRPGGVLIFDVANDAGHRWLLKQWKTEGSWVDDFWFTRDGFVKEMVEEGFAVDAMHPVHSLLHIQLPLLSGVHRRMPSIATAASRALTSLVSFDTYEWVAVCRVA